MWQPADYARLTINILHLLLALPLAWLAFDLWRDIRSGKNGISNALFLVVLAFLANELWSLGALTATLLGIFDLLTWSIIRIITMFFAAGAMWFLLLCLWRRQRKAAENEPSR